jgi:hypothetical protein
MNELSKLSKLDDLRKIWPHEAKDFSKWLSQEDNLSTLGDEIGLEMSLIQVEASVGAFSVDLLAEEEDTGKKIIIENQLEATNHDHLGKIITYASGYNAEVIIWIVKQAREEHRQAIDWLNEHTNESINFFLVEIELWKIGESAPAVKFQVISRPNDWAKTMRSSTGLTETQSMQGEFWEYFVQEAKKTEFTNTYSLRQPRPKHWYNLGIGSSDTYVGLVIGTIEKFIRCELYIRDNKELYLKLEESKEAIEAELGYSLEWMQLPNKKASRVKIELKTDIKKRENWEAACKWYMTKAIDFKKVFVKFIQ